MSRRRGRLSLVGGVVVTRIVAGAVLLLLTACSAGTPDGDDASSTSASGAAAAEPSASGPTPEAPPPATRPARPSARGCYRLDYEEALAPTTTRRAVDCARPHTATTFLVGRLDTVVGGHLLAVDARRVQARVAATCPRELPGHLGATPAQMRLTSLRAVWFSPTLEQSDAGEDWFRCDVIALAREGRLARYPGRLEGALSTPQGRERYGICGTSQPGRPDFQRVICSAPHSWRALSSYDVAAERYPGAAKLQAAAQQPCRSAGRAAAEDPLDYQWGFDWPTRAQWRAGQHYGLCWVPQG